MTRTEEPLFGVDLKKSANKSREIWFAYRINLSRGVSLGNLECASGKFSDVQNPFKLEDKVRTKVKGIEVEATVTKTWQQEVQVRTAEGLLWRSIYTVWRPGFAPLTREQKTRKQNAAAARANATKRVATPSAKRSAKTKKLPRKRSTKTS